MNTQNLYLVQVKEALSFYKNRHKEYKRLSLILLDNIIEVHLKIKTIEKIYKYYRLNLSESEIDSKIKSCENFGDLTKEACKMGLISPPERQIINLTHEIRNLQFHQPYPTEFSNINCQEKLIEYGAISNIEFLISKSSSIINLNNTITEFFPESIETLSRKVRLHKPQEILELLEETLSKTEKSPNDLLVEIILDNIVIIQEFFESEANENWNVFRKLALDSFSNHLKTSGKEISVKEIETFPKMNDLKFNKLKVKYLNLENKNSNKALESYKAFQNEYRNMIKGITIHQLLNSYYDDFD